MALSIASFHHLVPPSKQEIPCNKFEPGSKRIPYCRVSFHHSHVKLWATWFLEHSLQLSLVHVFIIPHLIQVGVHSNICTYEQDVIDCVDISNRIRAYVSKKKRTYLRVHPTCHLTELNNVFLSSTGIGQWAFGSLGSQARAPVFWRQQLEPRVALLLLSLLQNRQADANSMCSSTYREM
jgi:hypothetical protein